MPAAIDVDDSTKPLSNDAVNYPASEGAAELRAIKEKLNELFLSTGVEADFPSLITLNGKSLYANVVAGGVLPLYGHSSAITRTGGTAATVGSAFVGKLANGVTGTDGTWGTIIYAAHGETNSHGPLCAGQFEVYGRDHDNGSPLYGIFIKFSDRIAAASPTSGIGSNKYNNLTTAIYINSDQRGSAAEYCGWNNGIVFSEYSMDLKIGAVRGYCIDTYALHFDGPATPGTDYRVDAVMRLKVGQSIMWDDGAGAKGRLMFDFRTGSYMGFWFGDTMRFGVSIGDGHVNIPVFAGGGNRPVMVDNNGDLYV